MQDLALELLYKGSNFARLLDGLWVTLRISLLSVVLSIVFGILFGLFMRQKHWICQAISRVYLDFIRIMPQLVLLFLVYFGFTRMFGWNLSAEVSSVLVFTFWGTAEMGDLVRGALSSIPPQQYDSASALGLSRMQAYLHVIIPQTLRRLLPPAINLMTRMIKTTSLVVLIGIVEVLKVGQQIIDANRFEFPSAALWIYGLIFFLYFFTCWPISLVATHLENKWR
ncbi:amino acid ABC transporter permease [Sinanaerobacter sp. ZZT-01]|uniref:amino acid ABC transporter permease n=1 Tax=Sinanaerobacter sp. ZZT-01 TaxID=3111540 RepID=UPI002D765B72|nr:amino acid ABC transporter permease [Sinanaerobacter sp. ZZT-01]WRR94633.1 amino acid ABC transporter permease [Sinanaerobacter sp. ZZT-01]